MMLNRKALMLALAWAFILFVVAGFLQGVVFQILMFGLVAVLAFAVIEENEGRGLIKGRFFYKNYFGSARSVNDAWVFVLGAIFGAIVLLRPTLDW